MDFSKSEFQAFCTWISRIRRIFSFLRRVPFCPCDPCTEIGFCQAIMIKPYGVCPACVNAIFARPILINAGPRLKVCNNIFNIGSLVMNGKEPHHNGTHLPWRAVPGKYTKGRRVLLFYTFILRNLCVFGGKNGFPVKNGSASIFYAKR